MLWHFGIAEYMAYIYISFHALHAEEAVSPLRMKNPAKSENCSFSVSWFIVLLGEIISLKAFSSCCDTQSPKKFVTKSYFSKNDYWNNNK